MVLLFVMAAGAAPLDLTVPGHHEDPSTDVDGEGEGPVAAPVVNGSEATGNPDVVALAFSDPATGLLSVFCTASVIQDDWLLTAAHCITETNRGANLGLQRVAVWGNNINVSGGDVVIPWAEAITSPDYRPAQFTGDAGLVRLESPHPDPTWVVLRDEPFDNSQVGAQIEVFGFGATGDGRSDSGIKRTTVLPVDEVDDFNIITFTPESNVCSGDSGGPGFVPTPEGREQVGINAFVTPGCIGGRGGSTRVDQHIDWILELVPEVALDHSELPSVIEENEDGSRGLTDFGADDPQAFGIAFDDVDPLDEPGGGCRTPMPYALLAWWPVVALWRRRRSSSSPNTPAAA
ncbi:MAG: trypsin-like serine protease [Myxococcota bacterium]